MWAAPIPVIAVGIASLQVLHALGQVQGYSGSTATAASTNQCGSALGITWTAIATAAARTRYL